MVEEGCGSRKEKRSCLLFQTKIPLGYRKENKREKAMKRRATTRCVLLQ
jgi:hypothetical protein